MRGRKAGAEATHMAVEASTAPQTAILNLESSLRPAERRTQAQTILMTATAKIHFGQMRLGGGLGGGGTPRAIFLRRSMCRFRRIAKGRIRQIRSVLMSRTWVVRM